MWRYIPLLAQSSVHTGLEPLGVVVARCLFLRKPRGAPCVQALPRLSGTSCYPGGGRFSEGANRVLLAREPLPRRRPFTTPPADMSAQRFIVEYAKRGTAGCKKCKDKIQKGVVRIGKVVPNPFSESAGDMKEWHHVKCIFEKLEKARATTKKIEDITDLEGWEELQDEDKDIINKHVEGTARAMGLHIRARAANMTVDISPAVEGTVAVQPVVLHWCSAIHERAI